jgi:hypothetical protein
VFVCVCHNEHNELTENFDEIVLRKRILGRPRKRWNSFNSKLGGGRASWIELAEYYVQ